MIKNLKAFGYDFETFINVPNGGWWSCTFIEYENRNNKIVIKNDMQAFKDFWFAHSDYIFIGYNSRMFDAILAKGVLNDMNPCFVADQLINKGKRGRVLLRGKKNYEFINFDVMLKDKSLKQLELFMGHMIKESDIPFDISRPLSKEEEDEIIAYNTHDVQETLYVLDNCEQELEAMILTLDMFNLPRTMLDNTKALLADKVLGAVHSHTLDDEFEITIPERLNIQDKYKHVVDWYLDPYNFSYVLPFQSEKNNPTKKQLKTVVGGCPCIYARGGVHGSIDNCIIEGIIVIMDVGSLYPSLQINEGYTSRKLKRAELFTEMRDNRLKLKAQKDPKQQPLKIILNSSYGILKSKDKNSYDPLMSNNTCEAGQFYLTELIGDIEDYCMPFNINTDGVYVKCETMEDANKVIELANKWEERTKLTLDIEVFENGKYIAKDVNNYILIKDTTKEVKELKRTGAYVKKLSPIDNDLPIINKALIDYFVNDIPVEDTINNATKLIDFQQSVKLGTMYKEVIYGNPTDVKENGKIKTIIEDGIPLKEKVTRVFASTRAEDKGIYKSKVTKGEIFYEKISNTPSKCFIDNDNIIDKAVPEYLDRQYYIDLVKERIRQFITKEETKVDNTPNILFECMKKANTFYEFLENAKSNGITNKVLESYVIADCCKLYGKTKKLLDFIEVFNLLYGKDKLTKGTFDKKFTDETLRKLIEEHSTLSPTGKTLNNLDSKAVLEQYFDTLKNEHIHPVRILEMQIDKFNKPTFIDDRDCVDDSYWLVLNWRNEIKPNAILYNLKTGKIEYTKIKKESFNILPLKDKDIIKVTNVEQVFGEKYIGKDERTGEAIVGEDTNKTYKMITAYEICYRNCD